MVTLVTMVTIVIQIFLVIMVTIETQSNLNSTGKHDNLGNHITIYYRINERTNEQHSSKYITPISPDILSYNIPEQA